jgi:hypothetical protein
MTWPPPKPPLGAFGDQDSIRGEPAALNFRPTRRTARHYLRQLPMWGRRPYGGPAFHEIRFASDSDQIPDIA